MLDRDKYMSEKESRQLLKYAEKMALRALKRRTAFYVRAHTVISFLLHTGARATETRLMKIGDLHLKGSEPTVSLNGKNGKRRTIPVSNSLQKHLKEFLDWKKMMKEPLGKDDYLFLNKLKKPWTLMGIQNVFKKMAKEAGLRSVYSIHACRHTVGFKTFQNSKNIRLTQTILGHSNITTTQIYAHVDICELKSTMNNLW
jgi:site-specific recombinase XerD